MKIENMKAGLYFTLLAFGLFLMACGGTPETTGAAHGATKAHTAAYVCPMHCAGSGSDKAGKCDGCGMALIAQSEHTKDGHKHDGDAKNENDKDDGHDHDGHDHSEGDGHEH